MKNLLSFFIGEIKMYTDEQIEQFMIFDELRKQGIKEMQIKEDNIFDL